MSKKQIRSIILLLTAAAVLFFIFVSPFDTDKSDTEKSDKNMQKTEQKIKKDPISYDEKEKLIDIMCSNAYVYREDYGDSIFLIAPADNSDKNLFEMTTFTELKGQDTDADVSEVKLSNDLTKITFNPDKDYAETASFDCSHPSQYIIVAGDKYRKTDINKYSN